jgi:hypothetical protein
MRNENVLTLEERVEGMERKRRIDLEFLGVLAGAAGGAGGGAMAGPIGIWIGAMIGAAVGALASIETEIVEHEKAEHEKELDAIGLEPIPQPAH